MEKLLKKLGDQASTTLVIGLCVVLVIGVGYGFYMVKRNINYSFGYESMVKKTSQKMVCDMIKPEKYSEVLVNPKACN